MWKTILERSAGIDNNLEQIEKAILASYSSEKANGLLTGKMGYALYFSYLKEIKRTNKYDQHIENMVAGALQFDENKILPTFCSGISGILWGVDYLNNKKIIEADLAFDDYNLYLSKLILTELDKKNFDYLHGPIGNMLYLMDVAPGLAASIETKFIQKLKDTAEESDNMVKWEMYIRNTIDSGMWGYNLSLSHGMSSMIILLCMLYKKSEQNSVLIKELIKKSCNYILSNENKRSEKSLFPSYILTDQSEPPTSRLAWCYGDLGVGYAIYQAGQIINESYLSEKGIDILLKTTVRKDRKLTELNDACLCHGTAGVAHFYNRIYQQTKNEIFKDASLHWINETLRLSLPEKNTCAGYTFYNAMEKKEQDDYSFLEGLCGVGIILLAATATVEPKWDRSLFLS